MRFLWMIFAAGWMWAGASSGAEAKALHVWAAASLSDALSEIGGLYFHQNGVRVRFNFAGSNVLQRQIEEGAPADVFISADETTMDVLEKKGMLEAGTRVDLLSNALAAIVSRESDLVLREPVDLLKAQRIALADPKVVPAGIYARQFLEKEGLWKLASPKIIPTENVRAALAAVESGNADAGMVYRTDAMLSKRVKVAWVVPSETGPRIRYPAAVLKQAAEARLARDFLEFLRSGEAGKIFERYGFIVPKAGHGF